jgi:hypothetical protein
MHLPWFSAILDVRASSPAAACAFAQRDTGRASMRDDPRWTVLREQPRFTTLLHRMKLDGYGPGVTGP